MKKLFLLVLLTTPLFVLSQEREQIDYKTIFRNNHPLTIQDSIYLSKLPVLELPDHFRGRDLPVIHDNSGSQYLRPIFSQIVYPNCMQASSIAYGFTYEINCKREVSSALPENQYTTHFAWNFMNGGHGWFGVNYLHTHDVLFRNGTPNLVDYDGFYTGGGERWMTGYDKYYHAMQNRIEGIFAIPVNTEDGLLTLKHWLYDHLDGLPVGGVANFIACSPWNYTSLPDGTPEEGKLVMVGFCPEALHGMTIVGWNDSIRFDYNGDTRYTNDEDITGDGIIDMQDWEIGGVKFVNSYGDQWADSGYCYMMYRTLAAPIDQGGIWSNVVHIIKTKEIYDPMLTMKVKLKHNARNMIRVRTGVSSDASIGYPTNFYDFSIFQFQGSKMPMQGCDTMEACKIIEFGLDITPLLSYVESGKAANFFLQVYENDPEGEGTGEIIEFSLIDYTSGINEIPYQGGSVQLVNNGVTVLSIPATVNFSRPEISTGSLPAFTASQPYQAQLDASGGVAPYTWKLRNKYSQNTGQEEFPNITGQQLVPNAQYDSIFTIGLDFQFPFFGELYDTVRVNALGYVFFDEVINHWPYMKLESYFFKHIKAIAPFKSKSLIHYSSYDDGLWYEANEDYVIFRWKTSIKDQDGNSELNFALKLEADGNIKMYYNGIEYSGTVDWAGGISNGNAIDYHILDIPDPRLIKANTVEEFIYHPSPTQISISEEGLLEILADDSSTIYDIHVVASDQNNMKAFRSYQLSDLIVTSYTFDVNGDTSIQQGNDVLIDYSIKNISPQPLVNVNVSITSDDEFITITDGVQGFETLSPGETKSASGAFRFTTSPLIPDGHAIILENKIMSSAGERERLIITKTKAPAIQFADVQVDDGNNGRLDPNEYADLIIRISNSGRAAAIDVSAELVSLNNFVSVEGNPVISYGDIHAGLTTARSYEVFASPLTLHGFESKFLLKINDGSGIQKTDTVQIMVGKKPVLIIDLDPQHDSGPGMLEALNELEIYADYTRVIPGSLANYQSVFLALGMQLNFYELSVEEGTFLADYLGDGGKIYLESRRTWRDDVQTPLQSMFNIDIDNIPAMYYIVQGIDSTFTEGMAFENLANPPFNYYSLVPVPPAYDILQNRADSLSCAVAYDAGDYKTIGCVIEFGHLLDDTSSKVNLMEQILFFFDIHLSTIGIEEFKPEQSLTSTYNYPNPFSDNTSISFTLQRDSRISLGIYNLNGQLVQDLAHDKEYTSGTHIIHFNPGNHGLPGGIYLYRLVSDKQVVTRKMILLN